MQRIVLASANIQIDQHPAASETLFAYAGAFQLSLSTALAHKGVQLHSSYLGHDAAEHSSATHLLISPAAAPRLWTVEHDPAELPVVHARRYCLLDHLSVLADELRRITALQVRLEVPVDALEQLDQA